MVFSIQIGKVILAVISAMIALKRENIGNRTYDRKMWVIRNGNPEALGIKLLCRKWNEEKQVFEVQNRTNWKEIH